MIGIPEESRPAAQEAPLGPDARTPLSPDQKKFLKREYRKAMARAPDGVSAAFKKNAIKAMREAGRNTDPGRGLGSGKSSPRTGKAGIRLAGLQSPPKALLGTAPWRHHGSIAAALAFLVCFGVVLAPDVVTPPLLERPADIAATQSAVVVSQVVALVEPKVREVPSAEPLKAPRAEPLHEAGPAPLRLSSLGPDDTTATPPLPPVRPQEMLERSERESPEQTVERSDVPGASQSAQPNVHLASATPGAPGSGIPVGKQDLLIRAASFSGVWGADASACSARTNKKGMLPTLISDDGAWAGETSCRFKDKKQTADGWSVVAACSNPRERWTSSVRLKVAGPKLTWASERGTQSYVRCEQGPMMAAAQ